MCVTTVARCLLQTRSMPMCNLISVYLNASHACWATHAAIFHLILSHIRPKYADSDLPQQKVGLDPIIIVMIEPSPDYFSMSRYSPRKPWNTGSLRNSELTSMKIMWSY